MYRHENGGSTPSEFDEEILSEDSCRVGLHIRSIDLGTECPCMQAELKLHAIIDGKTSIASPSFRTFLMKGSLHTGRYMEARSHRLWTAGTIVELLGFLSECNPEISN